MFERRCKQRILQYQGSRSHGTPTLAPRAPVAAGRGEVALPPYGFSLGALVEQRWADYEGDWQPFTAAGESREDRTQSARLFLHNRRLAWNGFSPQLSLVHEVRETNAQGYDYKRTGGELRAVRLF